MVNEHIQKSKGKNDECYTYRYGVEPLLDYLEPFRDKIIWCPFDFEHSLYVRMLKENGFEVTYTHILSGGDFFAIDENNVDFDCIVSNPPFTMKDEILKRLYEIGKPFAILLPIQSLQSEKRTELFIKYGLELLSFDRRACFYTNNNLNEIKFGNHFASAYFCKYVLPRDLIFENLYPKQESYYSGGGSP